MKSEKFSKLVDIDINDTATVNARELQAFINLSKQKDEEIKKLKEEILMLQNTIPSYTYVSIGNDIGWWNDNEPKLDNVVLVDKVELTKLIKSNDDDKMIIHHLKTSLSLTKQELALEKLNKPKQSTYTVDLRA